MIVNSVSNASCGIGFSKSDLAMALTHSFAELSSLIRKPLSRKYLVR